jgi:tetratricopeptide (TPR) repeat protein
MLHNASLRILSLVLLSLCFSSSVTMGRADDQPKLHKASGVGGVYGFIMDADTHQYLSGANVALVLPSDMEPIKNSSDASDENGYYEIKAPLGSSSSHLALDRLLELSGASILSGGGKKVEHVINVSQMILTVSKPGYKTFYGTVPVQYADADKFQVRLGTVALMPETEPYASYVNHHLTLGKVESLTLSSFVLDPDATVKYTINFSNMPVFPKGQIGLYCLSETDGFRHIKFSPAQSVMTFSRDIHIDKSRYAAPGLYRLNWLVEDGDHRLLPCPIVSQIIAVGVPPENRAKMEALFATAPTGATQFSAGITKPDKALVSQMASLLPADANLADVTGFLDDTPSADGTPSLHQRAIGQRIATLEALLQNDRLSAGYRQAFQNELDQLTAKSTAAVSPAQKQQEFDQRVAQLKANSDDPKTGTESKMMLAHLYFSHGDFDQAWPLYEALFQSPAIKKKKDFYLFHDYGALLLGKGRHQEAIQYLSQALANGYAASQDASQLPSQVYVGTTSYTVYNGPERTNTNGFAYPEAADDLLIVENDTEQEPNTTNWLSETILGRSMTQIGLIDQGQSILQKVVQICPDQPEAIFALAFAQDRANDRSDALETVNHGLQLDPNDVDANQLKARLQATTDHL